MTDQLTEPTIRRVVLPGGHLVNQENTEGCNETLLTFLREHVRLEDDEHTPEVSTHEEPTPAGRPTHPGT